MSFWPECKSGAIQTLGSALNRYSAKLDGDSGQAVQRVLDDWRKGGKIRRLWNADASLWTGADESKWLGWLDASTDSKAQLPEIGEVAADLRKQGVKDAVLLGMGGSSLGAEVFARVFEAQRDWPRLHILDSTNPDAIRSLEAAIDLSRTAFIVSSKSGTTLEPNILRDYFLDRRPVVDPGKSGFTLSRHLRSRLESGSCGAGAGIPPHILGQSANRRKVFSALRLRACTRCDHGRGCRGAAPIHGKDGAVL